MKISNVLTHKCVMSTLIYHTLSSCMNGGGGGKLAQIESMAELNLLNDVLMYSTTSLPLQRNWLIGEFSNPLSLISTSSLFMKT